MISTTSVYNQDHLNCTPHPASDPASCIAFHRISRSGVPCRGFAFICECAASCELRRWRWPGQCSGSSPASSRGRKALRPQPSVRQPQPPLLGPRTLLLLGACQRLTVCLPVPQGASFSFSVSSSSGSGSSYSSCHASPPLASNAACSSSESMITRNSSDPWKASCGEGCLCTYRCALKSDRGAAARTRLRRRDPASRTRTRSRSSGRCRSG